MPSQDVPGSAATGRTGSTTGGENCLKPVILTHAALAPDRHKSFAAPIGGVRGPAWSGAERLVLRPRVAARWRCDQRGAVARHESAGAVSKSERDGTVVVDGRPRRLIGTGPRPETTSGRCGVQSPGIRVRRAGGSRRDPPSSGLDRRRVRGSLVPRPPTPLSSGPGAYRPSRYIRSQNNAGH